MRERVLHNILGIMKGVIKTNYGDGFFKTEPAFKLFSPLFTNFLNEAQQV